jgi:hypothetical protein
LAKKAVIIARSVVYSPIKNALIHYWTRASNYAGERTLSFYVAPTVSPNEYPDINQYQKYDRGHKCAV